MKCTIFINQDTKGLIEPGNTHYSVDTDSVQIYKNAYSQVGVFPNSTCCYSCAFNPTGLIFVPFIEKGDDDKITEFIDEVNRFLANNYRKEFKIDLSIDSINANQRIIITKQEEKKR